MHNRSRSKPGDLTAITLTATAKTTLSTGECFRTKAEAKAAFGRHLFFVMQALRCCRYVDGADLQLFKDRIERVEPPPGVGEWEPMMDKDFGNFTYTAWRRSLPVGCR